MKRISEIDTDNEMTILPTLNGIKLLKPNSKVLTHYRHIHPDQSILTLDSVCNEKFSFFIHENDGKLSMANEAFGAWIRAASVKSLIGKYPDCILSSKFAELTLAHAKMVAKEGHPMMFEESGEHKEGIQMHIITIRFPLLDENNKIIGIFGCTIPGGLQGTVELLPAIARLGLLSWLDLIGVRKKIFLSTREQECLYLLATGKTVKMIAKLLELSPRTVGHYLESVKTKINAKDKSELIKKAIEMGFISIKTPYL